MKHFLNGDAERARRIGVPVGPTEYAVAAVLFPFIAAKMALYRFALSVPGLRKVADRRLTARIRRLLKRYGHAEFTSDAEAYRPAVPVAA